MFKNNKKVLQQEKAPVSLNDSTEQRYSQFHDSSC